jgi:hypothetical protein
MEEFDRDFLNETVEERAALIGKVTIVWNICQSLVYSIFHRLTGMARPNSRAVFFSLKADTAQRDITLALAQSELSDQPQLLAKIVHVIHRLNQLSTERNAAIHTMWAILDPKEGLRPHPQVTHNKTLDINDPWGQFDRLLDKLNSSMKSLSDIQREVVQYSASRDKSEKP